MGTISFFNSSAYTHGTLCIFQFLSCVSSRSFSILHCIWLHFGILLVCFVTWAILKALSLTGVRQLRWHWRTTLCCFCWLRTFGAVAFTVRLGQVWRVLSSSACFFYFFASVAESRQWGNMFSGHMAICFPSDHLYVCYLSVNAYFTRCISLYLVEGFQWNLSKMFIVWVGVAEKVCFWIIWPSARPLSVRPSVRLLSVRLSVC